MDSESQESDQNELVQSRSTYQALVNTLPLSLLIKDASGRRLFANRAYLQFRQTTLEETVGKVDADLFPADLAKTYRDDDLLVMASGKSVHNVEETSDLHGNRSWIERIKSPVFDPEGNVIGVQVLFWDVSDRVLAEQALQLEKDLLGTLLRHIPDSIYFKDQDSRFVRISEAMASKFGLANADVAVGLTDADIFTGLHAEQARVDELRIMETREPLVDRIERETWPDHEDTWCLSTKMPMIDIDNNVIGTFGISRDITELKASQDALKKALELADQANRAKSDFLANMSHEIRTPMNAIIGISELLSQTALNPEQADYNQLVRDSADSLLRLLNDILDFSKIEARKLELEAIPFSIRDLVEKTGRTLSLRAAEKGLELACRVASDLPDQLLGDPGRIRQILINLIGNAIKFTDEGEVLIEVCKGNCEDAITDLPDDSTPVCFRVQDTGIGIPQDKLSSVLDAFTQADTSTTRRFGGTGLGLAITKQLVELMHGQLQLESTVGKGTTFYFTAHLPKAPSATVNPVSRLKELTNLPVLVVDDNETNRRILKEIMTAWKLSPTLADSGASAIAEVNSARDRGKPFSMVILDCMMPGMDGFEVAHRIRQNHDAETTKLIILSSADRQEDVQRCGELGIARYLIKPVVQSELLDTVLQVMGIQKTDQKRPEEGQVVCPPLKVLVAEDGLANQHVAVGMLKAGGHLAVVANDGREAVSRWQAEPFDVILMDMHMPVMDGIEATLQIRAVEEQTGNHIPIIAVTAAAMKEDADACLKSGMDAHLAKPIHPRRLQEMLAKFAPEHPIRSSGAADESADDDTTPSSSLSSSSGSRSTARWDAISESVDGSIDLRASATRVPGGLQGVRRLAEVFIPECESILQTLADEIPDGDVTIIRRAAHTLKGSSNLFFASRVSELAGQLEDLANTTTIATIPATFEMLKQESEVMLRALRNFLDLTAE
ncbi:hybrid sensor histidine kinase/response regulator [Rubripirellula reticaptiva]|uniref:Sensory/regulatory protein RpfC n=1 Tax=Rubripirellula reticaptiva TaxID=2528013 RepID=A0A5C6F7F2_9BACT|nr:response regulator [Rubripirellula reticaptiva]TWU55421.1 Signal transduction histidine-protein kinase BarA [Rubripirellula reticaptiva]